MPKKGSGKLQRKKATDKNDVIKAIRSAIHDDDFATAIHKFTDQIQSEGFEPDDELEDLLAASESLPAEDGVVDAYSEALLEHLPDQAFRRIKITFSKNGVINRASLLNIARALKPTGKMQMVLGEKGNADV